MTQTISSAPDSLPTEAELLAAREEEYMSPRQQAFFRARLLAEREALLGSARATTLQLQQGYATTPDPSDRASLEEDHTLELRVRDRERKQLHKIDQALARLDDGSYGWCQETGEPIGIARLIARPTASFTVDAQQRHETRKKMMG